MASADGHRLELIVFDFDGTLCDSADIKTVAFHALYLDEHGPEFADRVKEYHLANAGVPRYDKIRHIERAMLGNEPTDALVDSVADRFSTLVEDAVVEAPLFPGVIDFFERHRSSATFTIASATPTDELRRICTRKGMDDWFAAIDGAPASKGSIVRRHVALNGTPTHASMMVGDQPSDAAAATDAGVRGLMIGPDAPWTAPHQRVETFIEAVKVFEDLMR